MFEIVIERLVEVVVSLLAAWPLARHLARRTRRSDRKRWSAKAAAGTLLLIAYSALTTVSAFYAPMVLRGITVFALIGIGAFLWRARSGYGRWRGLPPGSLAPAPPAMITDQAFFLKQSEKHGPVFKVSSRFQPMVCVVGHGAALDLMKTQDANLSPAPADFNELIPKGFLRYMDEADHGAYRRLFQSALQPTLVASNSAALRDLLRAAFKNWNARVEESVTVVMFAVMARLFFGIATDDERYGRLRQAYTNVAFHNKGKFSSLHAERALKEIEGLLSDVAARLVAEPPEDTVLGALLAQDPEALDDPTVRRNLIYMMETAHRDVAGLMTWVIKLLSENRPWIDRLRANLTSPHPPPVDSKGRSLADRVIMESLRLERSEYLFRRTLDDVRIGPFTIPKGWRLRICIREGHRTNPVFEQPGQFNPDRFLDRTFDLTDYAPFGLHQRRCIGQKIAADVGRLILEELIGNYDFEVVGDGPVEFRAGHWHPNSAFQIRLIASSQPH